MNIQIHFCSAFCVSFVNLTDKLEYFVLVQDETSDCAGQLLAHFNDDTSPWASGEGARGHMSPPCHIWMFVKI